MIERDVGRDGIESTGRGHGSPQMIRKKKFKAKNKIFKVKTKCI
jgi:hypothetical protein